MPQEIQDFSKTWAINKVKLQNSYDGLVAAKKLDDSIEITEEAIKAEYVKRAGELRDLE